MRVLRLTSKFPKVYGGEPVEQQIRLTPAPGMRYYLNANGGTTIIVPGADHLEVLETPSDITEQLEYRDLEETLMQIQRDVHEISLRLPWSRRPGYGG